MSYSVDLSSVCSRKSTTCIAFVGYGVALGVSAGLRDAFEWGDSSTEADSSRPFHSSAQAAFNEDTS